ncbi:ABC-three component system protein [Pseudomonas syringae]|uniref:ABC-three component systems C-terminal domain-containing protein n=1 Tax=Pseudomonas syringae TaxID=317 RepID=A0AB38C0Y8_PSESX|nr:ABC-three component system protein [Pseudomonas syringae]SFO52184.1 hypothetical protein SAMN05444065_1273 [Pseudomonas syringae]SFO99069.1 hypothetical protein SAMN05444063_13541 [Pseudomonas syringae]
MQTQPLIKSSVPGQYFGFSIQPTRQCLHLLLAPAGSHVALEILDDTDVVQPDGEVLVEQSKSGLVTNPISDWSIDLWKTFANWIDTIEAGHIDLAHTRFHLYVVQQKQGDIVDLLKFSHSIEYAREAVEKIKKRFKKEKPTGCEKYLKKFLNYDPHKLHQLIVRFSYDCGDSDPIKPIKDILRNTVADISLDEVCCTVIGWVKLRSDELIGARKHAALEKNLFADWLSTYCSKFSYEYLLTYTVPTPEHLEVEANISKHPVMMHQLELIEQGQREKLRAMTDFMRPKTGKTRWAEVGFIVESQFEDYVDDLKKLWRSNYLDIKGSTSKLTHVEKGELLFLRCHALNPPLNGKSTPDYFPRGTFHYLADKQLIGWHPKYKELLEKKLNSIS